MHIWVDADACPKVIKEILYRASERRQVPLTLVANQALSVPRSAYIRTVVVAKGFDVADAEILRQIMAGDLVITGDIPLAAAVLDKNAHALSPRGERYSPDTIRERLRVRDLVEQLRDSGVHTGGPATLSQADRQAFANALDRLLAHA
ncbi:YaiI/YqxD family protein [Candidatus Igneacidithiobacillus taiwanensis]|uniref:YaiI/YqxD family protein n=1 Tax=Candidatus Igneacidithiobacillus taiwanensis TaxID=1945924 RepID=UPI002898440B|nr:YaiI/YqxD family protein [Candidatus Igneacidithiobacillus taiwanensis]